MPHITTDILVHFTNDILLHFTTDILSHLTTVSQPPPREVFSDIARSKNSERLRVLPETKEQQLPHIEHDCRMTIDCEYTVTGDAEARPTQLPSLRPSLAASAALKKAATEKLSSVRANAAAAAASARGGGGNPGAAAALRP